MPAWRTAGKEIVVTARSVEDNMDGGTPQVIIDLRQRDEAIKGHLPGAVSIPAQEIAGAKDRFPDVKRATIILYAADDKTASEAFKVVRGWGYPNTSVLRGGVEAWLREGNTLVSGETTTKIVYIPRPRPGSISIDDFKKVVETSPANKLILDVRDAGETTTGMLKGAINIPAQDIGARLAELPRGKEIIIHCVAGVRAEMAYHTLIAAGYEARFLHANIQIDQDGKYEITEN
jgi:rhodanese-related sulfurtransferase